MTITAPETKIQDYIEELEKCKDKANLELNKVKAEHTKSVNDYQRQKAIFDKLKGYVEKLEDTELLAESSVQSIQVVEEVLGNLEKGIDISARGIQCLTNEIISYSERLERDLFCLEELIKAIEKIRKAKFDPANPIVKGLRELKTAYEEAISISTDTMVEFLKLLECAFLLKYNMVGTQEPQDACYPEVEEPNKDPGVTDPKGSKTKNVPSKSTDSVDDSTQSPEKPSNNSSGADGVEISHFEGLKGSLAEMEKNWCSQFSILPKPDDKEGNPVQKVVPCIYENTDGNAQFANSILCAKEEKDRIVREKKDRMDQLARDKESKQSKKDAADKAFEAAKNAKKC